MTSLGQSALERYALCILFTNSYRFSVYPCSDAHLALVVRTFVLFKYRPEPSSQLAALVRSEFYSVGSLCALVFTVFC